MRYRRPRDPAMAARVQMFVSGSATPLKFTSPLKFNGDAPSALLESGDWAWHDMGTAVKPPPGAMTVWSFNGKSAKWGVGNEFTVEGEGLAATTRIIEQPKHWISALTFLASEGVQPDTIVMHVVNDSEVTLEITGLRLWLPKDNTSWQVLWPQEVSPTLASVSAKDRGFIKLKTSKLPLTYAALELQTNAGSLWTHQRIKREAFDISGGWVNKSATEEAYLRLLCHLHVNAGQIDHVSGYTDNPKLYDRYPLKLFNRLWPLEKWDTDAMLPKIHAVEFIGEPQYGGGKPVTPQQVFDMLLPYRVSRLPTSVTLSEERTWRWYAGLSDYPHYDAYRLVAPAADAWGEYDRWGGRRIRWGAPLETIGVMCRSLRELNRPMPCAYWSQGPHDGWGGGFLGGARTRRSPTPDELRSQAMHALSSRITSLYWFNLSLSSLLRYPDTWEPMTRIGREIRMLEPFLLEGDAYQFEHRLKPEGTPDWELASIVSPDAAVLFANDTSYVADEKQNVFLFGPPRAAEFTFKLPPWIRKPVSISRMDADGLHDVKWSVENGSATISDTRSHDAIYIAVMDNAILSGIMQRRQSAMAHEEANTIDEDSLKAIGK